MTQGLKDWSDHQRNTASSNWQCVWGKQLLFRYRKGGVVPPFELNENVRTFCHTLLLMLQSMNT